MSNTPEQPASRVYHTMVYSAPTNQLIVLGGQAYYHWGMDLQEIWSYDLTRGQWAYLGPLMAGGVYAAAFDAGSDRVVMLNLKGETWAYDPTTGKWEQRHPDTAPKARYGHRMVYEAHTGRVVLFGGLAEEALEAPLFDETWVYEYAADRWFQMPLRKKPPARIYHSMVYHPTIQHTLVWGGRPYEAYKDTSMWVFDSKSDAWKDIPAAVGPKQRLVYAPMVYVPDINEILIFGGLALSGAFTGEINNTLWRYNLAKNQWSQIAGSPPTARTQHAMVYAPGLGKAFIFGGEIGGAYAGQFTNELWSYEPPTNQWERLFP